LKQFRVEFLCSVGRSHHPPPTKRAQAQRNHTAKISHEDLSDPNATIKDPRVYITTQRFSSLRSLGPNSVSSVLNTFFSLKKERRPAQPEPDASISSK
jgi:hypothetical protein